MKTDAEVLVHLNRLLKNELTAINQYFLHARTLKHWGFERLGKKIYEESIGEMRHADKLTQRILMIEGHPNLQDLGKLLIGETVVECLESDLRLESAARRDVLPAIAHCEKVQDYVSRQIIVDILDDTEEHIDFLETELSLVEKVGLHNYLQSQMGSHEE